MIQLSVGDVLEDRYRIDHPIARGGMSTVYRCVDLRLGRAVAVKVMDHRYVSDPVFRQRFRREARAMGQLAHPNLVNVYDFSSDGNQLFLVMELITGGTLRELLAERGPMPPHAATSVLASVLTGLSAVHAVGLVHRDIKPDNVLINHDHRVKLADFGLVRVSSSSSPSSQQIIGTVAYLSPEQVDGSEITPASDVYSAGLVLFELLTGDTPFSGETPLDHAFSRLDEVVPAPGSMISGIPPLIDALVATATALDPRDRFADAGEFLAAVEDVASELRLPAFTVPVPENSAANRAAAVPTDITDLVGPATGVIDLPAADISADPPQSRETIMLEAEDSPETGSPLPYAVAPTQLQQPEGTAPAEPVVDSRQAPAPSTPNDPPLTNRSQAGLIIWLLLVVLITVSVAIGGWWFGSGRYGEIPQVLGMDSIEAVAVMEDAGFTPATRTVYSDEIPAEQIAGTDPEIGDRLVRGQEVTVLVSQGQPTVPSAEGMDILAFQEAASERTLDVVTGDPIYSANVPEGAVARTTPSGGDTAPIGSTVTVQLSRGPEPVQVPNLVGVDLAEAQTRLGTLGLNVTRIQREFDEDAGVNEVIDVSPPTGTMLTRGNEITLVVNNALEVPDVIGLDYEAATAAIKAAGFSVSDVERTGTEPEASGNTVLATSPSAGETVALGDTKMELSLPRYVLVPDLEGMTGAQANTALEDIGLETNLKSSQLEKIVTDQRPESGDDTRAGSTVRLSLED
ncbi:Stk1 family PASTA domain-containing Ser/Thr kinase [Corynebacterium alimapuense]|uniref:non-specific serine/threonine protein kinase n=1 Tax=Corynebacterium alimapuense TaxID=1576874 RepID=A0A3M8KB67_9CORY|nr:Stk1 family PASTA domain-containing Ser/Thr kinase [Corynebacterium alimapuense]RNE49772.1 Stk1 family PASTA domain-containing Ser/Thr kinase [Corynebacterium alimapuense]